MIPRAEKIKKTAEIMRGGLLNFAKSLKTSPTKIQIIIEPVGDQLEPKYRVMHELKDTGAPDAEGKPTKKYATFREILGHIDFLGYGMMAAGFFKQAFLVYSEALVNQAKMPEATPANIRFMVTCDKEDAAVPYMHLYVGFKMIQQITFEEIFPPEQ